MEDEHWSLTDDPADPGVGAIDVPARRTIAEEVERLRALGYSCDAIGRELERQERFAA